MKRFKLKTDIIFGNDALGVLKTIASDSAVLFTDAFMVSSGTADALKAYMTACKNITVFSDVKPDPPVELISQAVKFVMDVNADTVFALGGGSAIDAAKSTLMIIREHYGKNIKLIAIPTTSGTGSEVTQFSVITDTAAGKKLPLVDESMLPEIAVLDAELVKSVPPAITADTGFDVLTHALEAYISTEANDFSDALAEKAVELVADNLVPVYKNGADLDARAKMHTASCLAGIAFNEVSLGINHGIAQSMKVSQAEQKLAVECGYWPLFRYSPELAAEGKNPFQLDSKAPNGKLREFMMGEVRFSGLTRTFPQIAEQLFAEAEEQCAARYAQYEKLAAQK